MYSKADLIRCGNNLRRLRVKKGLLVEALAARSGVNVEKIIQFESGNGGDVLLSDLLLLAETMDVYIRDILTGP